MFRWEPSQDAFVIMYPEGIVKLNQTAGEILSYCDGKNTISDIVMHLAKKFNANEDFILEKVNDFLEVSHDKGWIRITS
jgi:pyrroloquinoline quinone biosynthesis protein D